jgi:transcription elongation factor Elf1
MPGVKVRCPRCGRECERLPAVSRADNETRICGNCGTEEAMFAFLRRFISKKAWKK